jgi:hypothetical protein
MRGQRSTVAKDRTAHSFSLHTLSCLICTPFCLLGIPFCCLDTLACFPNTPFCFIYTLCCFQDKLSCFMDTLFDECIHRACSSSLFRMPFRYRLLNKVQVKKHHLFSTMKV